MNNSRMSTHAQFTLVGAIQPVRECETCGCTCATQKHPISTRDLWDETYALEQFLIDDLISITCRGYFRSFDSYPQFNAIIYVKNLTTREIVISCGAKSTLSVGDDDYDSKSVLFKDELIQPAETKTLYTDYLNISWNGWMKFNADDYEDFALSRLKIELTDVNVI